jgi:aminoglycoside 6-adenylyltransferase
VLLDKDNGNGLIRGEGIVKRGTFAALAARLRLPRPLSSPGDGFYHIKPPSELDYYSACNNFWWCLNNVGKGIARDELPYVMYMLNEIVRPELHDMIDWYIGITRGFSLSTGKNGKYFKKYLEPGLYDEYVLTYSSGEYEKIWEAVFAMCALFHKLALPVAEHFGFVYNQDDEDGMMIYLKGIKDGR